MIRKYRTVKTFDGLLEPGLLSIFRLYCGGIAVVTLLISLRLINSGAGFTSYVYSFIYLSVTHVSLFIYLSIPVFRRTLERFFLPLAILISILAPIVLTNIGLNAPIPADMPNFLIKFDLTIVLLFPLVITAWQYSFDIVFLFFVVAGMVEPLILFLTREIDAFDIDLVYSSLIRAVVLSSLGYIITELMKRQRQQRKDLEMANHKLKEFAGTLEHLAESRERNRLARDLHDTLAHTLSGLAVQLEAVAAVVPEHETNVKTMLDSALATTREGLGETRAALKDLRSMPLDNLGLKLALQGLLENAADRAGFRYQFAGDTCVSDIHENHEQMIYRIAQEGLENIVRHAEAENVYLELSFRNGVLNLIIQDDGRGFNLSPDIWDEHFGLKGMQERADMISGNLTIYSRMGGGTEIRLSLGIEA